jgi:hypothetical protein
MCASVAADTPVQVLAHGDVALLPVTRPLCVSTSAGIDQRSMLSTYHSDQSLAVILASVTFVDLDEVTTVESGHYTETRRSTSHILAPILLNVLSDQGDHRHFRTLDA